MDELRILFNFERTRIETQNSTKVRPGPQQNHTNHTRTRELKGEPQTSMSVGRLMEQRLYFSIRCKFH